MFTVAVAGGSLGGWAAGPGAPVLMLYGGPGLSYGYLDELSAELAVGFRVACHQQRGLEPSTCEGPFTVDQAIDARWRFSTRCSGSRPDCRRGRRALPPGSRPGCALAAFERLSAPDGH